MISAKYHYNNSSHTSTGKLVYYITSQNHSSINQTDCIKNLNDLVNTSSQFSCYYGHYVTLTPFRLAAFKPNNSTEVLIRDGDIETSDIPEIIAQILDSDWFWVVLIAWSISDH